NGRTLYTLPVQASIQAVSGKQDKLFLFNSASKSLQVVRMDQIASVPGPGLAPLPADGSVVSLPLSRLSWSTSPLALRYAVYFGNVRNDSSERGFAVQHRGSRARGFDQSVAGNIRRCHAGSGNLPRVDQNGPDPDGCGPRAPVCLCPAPRLRQF